MNDQDSLFSGINPYSGSPSVAKLFKAGATITQGWSLMNGIGSIPVMVAFAVIGSYVVNVSFILPGLIALVASSLIAYIKYRSFTAMRALPTENTGKALAAIVLTTKKFEVLAALANLPIMALLAYFIVLQLQRFDTPLNFGSNTNAAALTLFVIFALFSTGSLLLHYYMYLKLPMETMNKAQLLQSMALIDQKTSLVFIPVFPIAATLVYNFLNANYSNVIHANFSDQTILYGSLIVWGGSILFFLLTFVMMRRIASVDLSKSTDGGAQVAVHKTGTIASKKNIALKLFGVWNSHKRASMWLGKGKVTNGENVLVFTDSELVALFLPMTGEGPVTAGTTDILANEIWNRGEIKQKAEDMISALSFEELVEQNEGSFIVPFDAISSVVYTKGGGLRAAALTIVSADKNLQYHWLDQSYGEMIEKELGKVLGEKFRVE